ncbi:MAG: hypothetical protein ACKOUR_05620, partial [Planctomycetota bacterium]
MNLSLDRRPEALVDGDREEDLWEYTDMLDRLARRCVDPLLVPAATMLAALEVPGTAITLTGFALGITGCVAISQGDFLTGLTIILL